MPSYTAKATPAGKSTRGRQSEGMAISAGRREGMAPGPMGTFFDESAWDIDVTDTQMPWKEWADQALTGGGPADEAFADAQTALELQRRAAYDPAIGRQYIDQANRRAGQIAAA